MPASTAILVKTRAKFKNRLKNNDYEALLSCHTIPDIAAFLKSKTVYGPYLQSVQESAVHRGNLEMLLRRKIFDDFAALCRFERTIGEHYYKYLLLKAETDQIILYLRYFIAGTPEKYLFTLPDFFIKNSHIDFLALTQAKTFENVLKILENTRYYELLVPFIPSVNSAPDFTMIEAVLDRNLYNEASRIITKHFRGKTKDQLIKIFNIRGELDDIRKIYRAKKYYNVSDETVNALLNGRTEYLNKHKTEEIINGTAEDIIEVLNKTKYRNILSNMKFSFIDDMAARMLYDFCRRNLRFSRHPAVVMASALILSELEMENITNIIEGKRYGVKTEDIRVLLVS